MNSKSNLEYISDRMASFFTKIGRESWKNYVFQYLVGLIMLLRFRSISELSNYLGYKTADRLHHFLHDSPWDEQASWREHQRSLLEKLSAWGQEKLLIIDDTVVERTGKAIEGLGFHHSGNGLVRGLCAVTSLVCVGTHKLVWQVLGYRPKKTCAKTEFKSKLELALDILAGAALLGAGVTVLMDAWYTSKLMLNAISDKGWRFVGAIRNNRVIQLDGRKTHVRCLAKGPRSYVAVKLTKRRVVKVSRRLVFLPGVGEVALFITKTGGSVTYLISNDLSLSPAEAVRLYAQRWTIETFHRDIKQHLGLKELWMRSWRAVQKHWTLCALAYNLLQLWNNSLIAPQRSLWSVVKCFRSSIKKKNLDLFTQKYRLAS